MPVYSDYFGGYHAHFSWRDTDLTNIHVHIVKGSNYEAGKILLSIHEDRVYVVDAQNLTKTVGKKNLQNIIKDVFKQRADIIRDWNTATAYQPVSWVFFDEHGLPAAYDEENYRYNK